MPMPLWSEGRDGAIDAYDARRGLARLKAGLGLKETVDRVRAGRYEVLELTGAGGFGRVYRAHDPELEREVALKAIPVSVSSASEARRIARAEAQTLAGLSHPNVIQVYDVFIAPSPRFGPSSAFASRESDLFIVMPFVRGQTLHDWCERSKPSADDIIDAYVQAARGLAAAHRAGLVHRDFKPKNAMRDESGRVLVLDFGVATVGSAGQQWSGDELRDELPIDVTVRSVHHRRQGGTPAYMAPEQYEGTNVTPATDVYAFALSLWEGLTGARPFTQSNAIELWEAKKAGPPPAPPEIARSVAAVLRRALAPAPRDRWPTMESMLDALLAIRSNRRRRRRMLAGVSLATVLGATVLLAEKTDCRDSGEAFESRWTTYRPSLEASLSEANVSTGASDALVTHLDDFVTDWVQADGELCREDTTSATARVRSCLEGTREAMWARVAAGIDSEEGARAAVTHPDFWPVAARCSNEELMRRQSLPNDPDKLARLQHLTDWLREASVDPDLSNEDLEERLAEARDIGHLPTVASTLLLAGKHIHPHDPSQALQYFEESYTVASDGGADREALSAAVSASAAAANIAPLSETQRWVKSALALSERIANPGRLPASAHMNMAIALANVGKREQAVEALGDAYAYAEKTLAPEDPFNVELHTISAGVYVIARDFELGIDSAQLALMHMDLDQPHDIDRINEVSSTLAAAYNAVGRSDEAMALLHEVVERPETDESTRFRTAGNLALYRSWIGEAYEALEAIEALEASPRDPGSIGLGNMLSIKGTLLKNMGNLDRATTALRRARNIYDQRLPPGHAWITRIDRLLDELQPGTGSAVVAGSEP